MRPTTLLALLSPVLARPTLWLSGGIGEGDCGLLVSNRRGDGGMLDNGYTQVAPPRPAVYDAQNASWQIPVSDTYGWFVTTESGLLLGPGSSSGCDRFRSLEEPTNATVQWFPPAGATGNHTIECAYASPMSKIFYYALVIDLDAVPSSPSSDLTPPSPPLQARPPPPPPVLQSPPPPFNSKSYAKSAEGELNLLWGVSSSGYKTLLGRSYNGNDWESARLLSPLQWDCSASECNVGLPISAEVAAYELQTLTPPPVSAEERAARFLLQSTFGPTLSDIVAFAAGGMTTDDELKQWISDQMALPETLHRSYYRARVNQPFTDPTPVGAVVSPCDFNSRWVRYAFQKQDEQRELRISQRPNGDLLLQLLNPVFDLTIISTGSSAYDSWNDISRANDYTICEVDSFWDTGGGVAVGRDIRIALDGACARIITPYPTNPPIDFEGMGSPAGTLVDMALNELDGVPDTVLLAAPAGTECNADSTFALSMSGEHYRLDRRMTLAANTPTAPCSSGACAVVAKTFVNDDGCVLANGVEACGSPGEDASDPALAHRYGILTSGDREALYDLYRPVVTVRAFRQMVHNNIAINAPDQLRQRMAFALSQIVVVGAGEDLGSERWIAFYDIFVRHAFGNFFDLLKEVSYSPVMGHWLTYLGVESHGSSGKFPDENYAREIMQLFSIGLWQLNEDGTRTLDGAGQPIPTYDDHDIVTFARAWTGFRQPDSRDGIESDIGGTLRTNWIDPMPISPQFRDALPKMDLHDGYIGDGYPLCADLPPRAFLRMGARFVRRAAQAETDVAVLQPRPASSALYAVLCAEADGRCTFPSTLELSANLVCDDAECTLAHLDAVSVVDDDGREAWYEYVRVPCVKLAFYVDGMRTTPSEHCASPSELREIDVVGGAACAIQVQVEQSGFVSIVHPGSNYDRFQPDSGEILRVPWAGGDFPTVESGCDAPCEISGLRCMCTASVSTEAVFARADTLPSPAEADEQLRIGAPHPDMFDAGQYVQVADSLGVELHVLNSAMNNPALDETAIFGLPYNGTVRYFFNKRSTVSVAEARFSFRNAPHFNSLVDGLHEVRDAEHETDAVLDHLYRHPNTAPFLCRLLIQRFTTSNPSPRYVASCSAAFRTGTHDGVTYSGKYGDLGAAAAAILLDREARDEILDSDPTYGQLREPLLKVLHLLRSLSYQTDNDAEFELNNLEGCIGQQAHQSPTVFNFFKPDTYPAGIARVTDVVVPESELGTAPFIACLFNGMSSLVTRGLTSCGGGFGSDAQRNCDAEERQTDVYFTSARKIDALMGFVPAAWRESTWREGSTGATSAGAGQVIDELSLLLTAGRLSPDARDVIVSAYQAQTDMANDDAALARALQLFAVSLEFHTTNVNELGQARPLASLGGAGTGSRYKAVVVLFMQGGLDSFNLLVPHSNCKPHPTHADLYAEYRAIRGFVGIDKAQLLPINSPAGTQPCDTFGVNPEGGAIRDLYNDGQLSFVANSGVMIEPIADKDEFRVGRKRLPPKLFSHSDQQEAVQTVYPQASRSSGVIGRISGALVQASAAFKTEAYSVSGKALVLEGGPESPKVIGSKGIEQVSSFGTLETDISKLISKMSSSVFGEVWGSDLQRALADSVQLPGEMDASVVTTRFGNSELEQQFYQVAKVIKGARGGGDSPDRQAFFVSRGGFDTHGNTRETQLGIGNVGDALSSFADEMITSGAWDDVVVVTVSDFGRTLTDNGRGTDHAWGGNMMLAGGSVKGGQILGQFPDRLAECDQGCPLNIGRGRLIPTTPLEAVWQGVAQWFGVPEEQLDAVLPNRPNFPPSQLFTESDLFNDASTTVRSPPPPAGAVASPPPAGAVASPPPAGAVASPPPPAGAIASPPPPAGAVPCSALILLGPNDNCNHIVRRNPVECPKFAKQFDGEIKQCIWESSTSQCRAYGPFGQLCLMGMVASTPPPPVSSPPPPSAGAIASPPPPAGANSSPPPLAGAVPCSALILLGPNDNCNHIVRRNPVECPKFAKQFDGEIKQCIWESSTSQCRAYGPFGQRCLP